jgi:hypothetical protein
MKHSKPLLKLIKHGLSLRQLASWEVNSRKNEFSTIISEGSRFFRLRFRWIVFYRYFRKFFKRFLNEFFKLLFVQKLNFLKATSKLRETFKPQHSKNEFSTIFSEGSRFFRLRFRWIVFYRYFRKFLKGFWMNYFKLFLINESFLKGF